MLVEVEVQSLGLDRKTNNPVVILKEANGPRVLPIWIGPGEASAIAVQIAEMEFPRPLTHDLMATLVDGLGATVLRMNVTRVEQNTFFAELVLETRETTVTVDARPSDSIALALRAGALMYVEESLLQHIQLEVAEGLSYDELPDVGIPGPTSAPRSESGLEADALEKYLKQLNPEDFGRFTP